MEIVFMIITIFFFALTLGLIIGETLSEINRRRAEVRVVEEKIPQADENPSVTFGDTSPVRGGEDIDPMTLRNGYGVTRDRNPTFAEQWVNIMNYNGESQTEGDYEETGNDPEDDLG